MTGKFVLAVGWCSARLKLLVPLHPGLSMYSMIAYSVSSKAKETKRENKLEAVSPFKA